MPKPECIFSTTIDQTKFHYRYPSIDQPSVFKVYSITQLSKLIQSIQTKSTTTLIRYLVDQSRSIWFAEGGYADHNTPLHYQMTGQPAEFASCLAAGYLELSKNYQEIIMINNNSGFGTTLDSLQWPLIILAHYLAQGPISLASELTLEQFSPNGAPADFHTLTKHEIKAWSQTKLEDPWLHQCKEQPDNIKPIIYIIDLTQHRFLHLSTKQLKNQPTSSEIHETLPPVLINHLKTT